MVGSNRKEAVKLIGEMIDRNILVSDELPTFPKVKETLNSKRYDYAGNAIEHMQELDAEKVIAAWPPEGAAGVGRGSVGLGPGPNKLVAS